jgi:hypothetical protein
MQEHQYAICRKLLYFAWNSELVERLERGLTLIVFYHISLEDDFISMDFERRESNRRFLKPYEHVFHIPGR